MGSSSANDTDAATLSPRPRRNSDETKASILDAAISEFSKHGLLGARIDAIAQRTNTTKRMIYYYYNSKEGLWEAALTETYRRIRSVENNIDVSNLSPIDALRKIVDVTITHFEKHHEDISLVVFENTLEGGSAIHVQNDTIRNLNSNAVPLLDEILQRGRAQGVFWDGPGAPNGLDLHQILTSMVYMRQTNRYTFRQNFGRDMLGIESSGRIHQIIHHVVLPSAPNNRPLKA